MLNIILTVNSRLLHNINIDEKTTLIYSNMTLVTMDTVHMLPFMSQSSVRWCLGKLRPASIFSPQ